MGPIRNKPKALSKSKRCMLVSSLVLVLLGCGALYWAMQNQDWTQNELTQRKIFFVAFLLLMASLLLSYWALSGDLEDDTEKERNCLTTVKHGQYNSIKTGIISANEHRRIYEDTQRKYIELLEPGLEDNIKSLKSKRTSNSKRTRSGRRHANTPIIADCEEQTTSAKISHGIQTPTSEESNYPDQNQPESKSKSIIVELMPLLPLQLCEFDNLDLPPQSLSFDPSQLVNMPRTNLVFLPHHSQSNLPRTFNPVHKNAEAG